MIRKICMLLLVLISILGVSSIASAIPYDGVEFPCGAISFVDKVVSYTPGIGAGPPYTDPSGALGVPEYSSGSGLVSLGDGGEIILKFEDNYLIASGNSNYDLWIFEVGAFEPVSVAISVNGMNWIDVGQTISHEYGIDIDQYIPTCVGICTLYSYVRLIDLLPSTTPPPDAGADIDAVGAISCVPAAPVPEPATMLLFSSGLLVLAGFKKKLKSSLT